jgi:hypothetical protein
MTKMNFLEKTGLLSGFDPQNKLTTLSFILKTLMAAYARVNNRIVPPSDITRFFSTNNEKILRFLLPTGSSKVMSWTIGYLPRNNGGISDCLTMDLKHYRVSNPSSATPASPMSILKPTIGISLEKSIDLGDVYLINLETGSSRVEGNYHFFVIYYELNGKAYNSYVSNFQEDIGAIDRANYLATLSEYVKYLTSGNKNYGEYFHIFERNENSLTPKDRIKNKTLVTPSLRNTSDATSSVASVDQVILPVVNVVERKDRRGGITTTYEIAYASDLSEQCGLLFKYIKAIHASGFLTFPMSSQIDDKWCILVRDSESSSNRFSLNANEPLIGILSYDAKESKRHLDRVVIYHSNISRLIFGTDVNWLTSLIDQDIRFKSPGNGALLQILLGKCSEEGKILMICSSLAREVDGIYNDLLGKSTTELEDSMIVDANLTRSFADVGASYFQLTGIDTDKAYHTNYAELFRLLSRLRSGGSDYFVPILQPQINFSGTRQNSKISDSTKLTSLFNRTKIQKVIKDAGTGIATVVARVEGGMFFRLSRDLIVDRGILCPFSEDMKEISEIFGLYGENNSLFTPLGLNSNQLTHLNQHQPVGVRFLSDGTLLPRPAKPFIRSNATNMVAKLPEFKSSVIDFIMSESFFEKLDMFIAKPTEYKFACMLAKRLGQVPIFDLLGHPENAVICEETSACDDTITTLAEQVVPHVFTNVVINSPNKEKKKREAIFKHPNMLVLIESLKNETTFSPLDRVNGFLLSSDWRKSNTINVAETFYKHIALGASVFYARNKITKVKNEECELPCTEAIWPNFGIVPHIECSNGDVLIRTLNGSLSQRSNALAMILAHKHWSFVVGALPKAGHSINTDRQLFQVKHYARDAPIAAQTGPAWTGTVPSIAPKNDNDTPTSVPSVSKSFAELYAIIIGCVQRNPEQAASAMNEFMSKPGLFQDVIKDVSSGFNLNFFKLKPERRKLIMTVLYKEWKSLCDQPLSKRNNQSGHFSYKEFHKLIHTGLKSSFVIDGKPYFTEEHKAKIAEEFIESL